MDLTQQLAPLGIHQHVSTRTRTRYLVFTAPGQPAPSEETELALGDWVFCEGEIVIDCVVFPQVDHEDLEADPQVLFVYDEPTILHFAAQVADGINERQ